MEKVVEIKMCKHCGTIFDITDKDGEFYEKISPSFGGKKYLIPAPTLCLDCRYQRRLSFRNERSIYKRKCDFSGKYIISTYSPDKPFKVYNQEIWWSDKWDALDYGKDFDFSQNFFEQFRKLIREVPKINLHSHISNENCLYTNYFVQSKDCYFCFGGGFCENVHYSSLPVSCKNSLETFFSTDCENCYEISHSKKCYKLMFSDNCDNCSNSYFLDNCNGCKSCFFCYGLDNKEYYIFNKKTTKEDFEKITKNIFPLKEDTKKQINSFYKTYPILYQHLKNSEKCSGDYIYNSKFCRECFNAEDGEDSKYCNTIIKNIKNCYDTFGSGINCENTLELITGSMGIYNILFSSIVRENCKNIFYCFDINNSSNLFGCIGLRNKSYCILNKQYTKEEYEILVPKIIEHMMKTGEWGEFFPSSLSPFGYNETVAQEYSPLNPILILSERKRSFKESNNGVSKKEDIKWIPSLGLEGQCFYIDREGNTYKSIEEAGEKIVFKWSNYEAPFPKVEKIIPASKLPSNITEIPDDILNWAIECEVTKKPFRIISQELEFYRKHNLPLPRRHPDQRHLDRMSLRNPRKLFERICDKCGKEIQTTYSPERPERVYCEECYNKEVY